ncbi:MAG: RibD family protein [Candidatus Aminicenantes bacterium]|nr:RibD family protein [Candidatus Aminicenantes bacterium]
MPPKVILHTAVSADGRIDWFTPDVGLFYGLLVTWDEDATLAGSETLLRAPEQGTDEEALHPKPESEVLAESGVQAEGEDAEKAGDASGREDEAKVLAPLLVVVDSRGRVRNLAWWRSQPYWRDVVVLCSQATPSDYLDYLNGLNISYFIIGRDKVDLRAGLEALELKYGVKTVRVDSGGTLSGVLLREGLVDEVSLLLSPALVGGTSPKSSFRAPDLTSPDGVIALRLIHAGKMDGDVVWLRYEVVKQG